MTGPATIAPLRRRILACALLCLGAVAQLLGTDLVLPAIPTLPAELGGDAVLAQYVLAVYVLGVASGLVAFGMFGARFGRRRLLIISAFAFAIASIFAGLSQSMEQLIGCRFVQGFVSSAPTVFGAGLIRAMFSEAGATRAIGVLGSLESLAPALGPVIGAGLLYLGDWSLSFHVLGGVAMLTGLLLLGSRGVFLPSQQPSPRAESSYLDLLKSPTYLRYALSQATVLGGLLIFVFGAPLVIETTMGGTVRDFIIMQVTGVTCFIIASNVTSFFVARYGAEFMIWFGTAMGVLAMAAMSLYAGLGGRNLLVMAALFAPLNAGLGLRGPPGFLRAIIAGNGDDDRAASLMILSILAVAAIGTMVIAPLLSHGLLALSLGALIAETIALGLLFALPPLKTSVARTTET